MCTSVRFTDGKGAMFWGRNYDWNVSYGETPLVMPKGYQLTRAFGDSYASKHACIGMSIEYDGYPLYFNCGNDAGLTVGGLNFAGYACFETEPVPGKTNIAAYEMPAWVGATFTTVDEAEEALRDVAIVGKSIAPSLGVAMLHWHIADAQRSIVVEYQKDGMHIYHNRVDVLTNQPPFPWHEENLRNYLCCNGNWPGDATWQAQTLAPFGTGTTMRGIPGDASPTSRFVKAAFVNAFHPQKTSEHDNVMRMLHTLASVAFVEGTARKSDGSSEVTIFSDCFSAATSTYYFNTYDDPALRSYCLKDYADTNPSSLIKLPKETAK